MSRGEIQGVGKVTGDALSRAVTVVRGVHQAVSGRVFGVLGPVAAPVRVVHDGIAGGVYSALEGTHRVIPQAVAYGVALAGGETSPRIAASPTGSITLGILNGIGGDVLADTGNELALPMGVSDGQHEVPPNRAHLADAFRSASPRLAVFVHGLCESDQAWLRAQRTNQRGERSSYGLELERDLGYTSLYVRYNSGLHVSDNGRRLSDLLGRVVEEWPCPVEEIAFVGHSMGGLVVRSACHQGAEDDAAWTGLVRHVFCLGTPHLGSHVEQGANIVAWALGHVPETRPFARELNSRSAGIKDMRFGSCVESDWQGCDPDEFLRNRCREVPFLPTANYYFVAVTLTRDSQHPFGRLFGDLLVRSASASGQGRRRVLPFDVDNGHHLGGLHHFQLLNHPAVYEQIRYWLTR